MKRDTSPISHSDFENIFELGIKKLKNFGFVNVTKENILLDEVYSFFFLRFMSSLKGKTPELDKQIENFLNSIEKQNH